MSKAPRAPITSEDLRLAGVDLTRYYLNGYYASWRLAKVLTIQKLIQERHTFFDGMAKDIAQHDDLDGAATIAQEVRNGLHFDAIAHCVQYVEDLFALIHASRKPQAFIRDVINYKAGGVAHTIKTFKAERKRIGRAYHFPHDLAFQSTEGREAYEHGIDNLMRWTADLVRFYTDYEFFYGQYKHGLTVAMRPFGMKYTSEQIEEDRRDERRPYLAVFDNRSLKVALSKGTADVRNGVMVPGFTDPVRRVVGELERRREWLFLVHPKDSTFSFEVLVEHAFKARACITTFCANFSRAVDPDSNEQVFQLPVDSRTSQTYQCRVPKGDA